MYGAKAFPCQMYNEHVNNCLESIRPEQSCMYQQISCTYIKINDVNHHNHIMHST